MNTLQAVESAFGMGGESGGGGIFASVGSGLAVATTVFKAVKFVRQGQMGVRTSFGRATYPEDHKNPNKRGKPYGIVGRGPKLVWPFTHSIVIIDIKDRTTTLPEIFPDTDKGHQFKFSSSLTWAVSPEDDNPLKSYFNLEKPDQLVSTVVNVSADGLRMVLEGMSSVDMKNKPLVEQSLFATTGGGLLNEYGVVMKGLNVINSTRSDVDRLSESIAQAGRVAPVVGGLAATGRLGPSVRPEGFSSGIDIESVDIDSELPAASLQNGYRNLGYL